MKSAFEEQNNPLLQNQEFIRSLIQIYLPEDGVQ
jgi:hypothetical protein